MSRVTLLTALAVCVLAAPQVFADTLTVDFENTPALSTGPSTFAAAGAMQTITITDKVTFTGGVVLGFPTNFPAIPYASSPNLYGTADFGHSSLSANLTIDIDSDFLVNLVEGVLFNGQTTATDYTVTAYSGDDVVASQTFYNVAPNNSSGFSLFSLSDGNITKVVFTPESATDWDYFIDTVKFNEPLAVPLPAAVWAGFALLGGLGAVRRVRRSKRAAS